jgi:D-sedoheptulose 7-phosphate isomerase
VNTLFHRLYKRYPDISSCAPDIETSFLMLKNCFMHHGKLMICGNGGSASDADHIVGELMKDFVIYRNISNEERHTLYRLYGEEGKELADKLQGALPAISLNSHHALITAISNDIDPNMIYAQQVYAYGNPGDVLLAISTSGNSKNVIFAVQVAKAKGIKTIGLTGHTGGRLKSLCDVAICVPYDTTLEIQERHLPIYHTLCAALEEDMFHQ